jgi:hypothetical protein
MKESRGNKRVDYSGLIIGVILTPVLLLFIYFGKGEMGRAACIRTCLINSYRPIMACIFIQMRAQPNWRW